MLNANDLYQAHLTPYLQQAENALNAKLGSAQSQNGALAERGSSPATGDRVAALGTGSGNDRPGGFCQSIDSVQQGAQSATRESSDR